MIDDTKTLSSGDSLKPNEENSEDHDARGGSSGVASVRFRAKVFRARRSLLSEFYEQSNDARALFCLVLAMYLLLLIRMVLIDSMNTGNPFDHLWLIRWNFRYFSATMLAWSAMASSILIPYYLLKFWASVPSKTVQLSRELSLFIPLILYYMALVVLPIKFVYEMELNPACSFIITCENTRIAMKVHSFVREIIPRMIPLKRLKADENASRNVAADIDESQYPTIKQLYYYFFCPSLLYRDSYPLAPSRSWKIVFFYFLQVLASLHFVSLIFVQLVQPQVFGLNYAKVTLLDMFMSILTNIAPGFLCLLVIFYGLLHCWLNMFAELLYFADRHFYANWWWSNNMAVYYRNWNLVVHDWLYAYVYRDVSILLGGKAAITRAQVIVFFLSSVTHEYWFSVALRLFYPLIFTLYFVVGGVFFIASRNIRNHFVWNVLMWINLSIGSGIFMALYSQEWSARRACAPAFANPSLDLLVPRHWVCHEML